MEPLTQEERQVLDHVHRYRLTTPEALVRRFLMEQEAAEAIITSLQDKACLSAPYPLFGDRVYFQLTDRAGAEYFHSDESNRPLSRPGLAKAYAILAFCCLGKEHRERILKAEFQREFPGLYRHRFPYPDYFVARGTKDVAPLGLLSVDSGAEAERQVRRVHSLIERLCEIDGFRGLLQAEMLLMTVITASPEKAARLKAGFSRRALPAPPHIVVIPELMLLHDQER